MDNKFKRGTRRAFGLLCIIQVFSLVSLGAYTSRAVGGPRQWTSSDGRTITATLLDVDRANQDQAMFTLSWDELSLQDVSWIRKTWGTRGTKYPAFSWDQIAPRIA